MSGTFSLPSFLSNCFFHLNNISSKNSLSISYNESTDPTFNVVAPQSTAPPAPTSALPLSTSTSAAGGALTGVYSSSGFDMTGILSRVVNRPNPLIDLGPIDMDTKRKKKVVASATEENPKICAHCHRKDSPEWRRGPNGPKELCNACGLKYAKAMAAASKRQQGDPSSNVGLVGSGEGEH